MNKLKHTKKTDFQNTLNLDSKSQLAKLLATENITVQHNNVATASFDVGNRVLTLPIFKIKNKHVYDMLITHECGHALHTKVDDWSEIGSDDRLRMAVNILEDTRIDKIMQKSYPGVVNDYKKGFDVLNDSNFYGLDDNNINELSVLDKINMRSKSLERLDIEFSDDELKIVKKVDNIKTFDDVMTLAKDILAYQEKEDKKQMMNQGDISMSGGDNEDADGEQDSDEHKDDDGQMRNEDSHSDSDKESESDETERKDDETYTEYQDRLEKLKDEMKLEEEMANSSMAPKDMQDDDFGITNRQFEKSVQELTQTDKSSKRAYANLPNAKLENTIITYKQWFKDFGNSIDEDYHEKYKSQMLSRYSKFKSDSMKTVNYLVKEFEMKKSATAYKRASTSKTGVIDPMMLSKYKFTDDIFKKLTIVPDAKNHGMIILVDWSGSMSDVLPSVIQQLMNLAWFCRKINIPFEVYAFSNYYGYDYDTRSRNLTESFDLKSGDINMKDFKLVNFLSHKMNNQDFEHGMLNMYLTLECTDNRGYGSKPIIDWSDSDDDGNYLARPISLPSCMHLGSTPLNQALATMIDIIPKFKSKYNIEKLSFITLTDGASDSGEGIVDDITYGEQNKERQIHTQNVDGRLVINVKGKNYDMQSNTRSVSFSSDRMTSLLLQIIKQRYDTNNIGFYLIPAKSRRHLHWAIDEYDSKGNYIGSNLDDVMKDLTKDNVHLTPKSGYDKYFITVGNTRVESADLSSLDSDAKTSDIKRLFRKSMTGRLKSRVLLNNFIEEVA
tara:strand:- start:136 stop:2478 length:2343 start_codon:yes stop_codon:yes gene_type:complete